MTAQTWPAIEAACPPITLSEARMLLALAREQHREIAELIATLERLAR